MDELDGLISEWTSKLAGDETLALLHDAGIPAGRTFTARDMLADPHFEARKALVRLLDPQHGEIAMQNVFPRLSETPGAVRHTGPELGEANHAIYHGLLGLEVDQISELESAGII